jgi:hypothetical protein
MFAVVEQAPLGRVQLGREVVGKHLDVGLARQHALLDTHQAVEGGVRGRVTAIGVLEVCRHRQAAQRGAQLLAERAHGVQLLHAARNVVHAQQHPRRHAGQRAQQRAVAFDPLVAGALVEPVGRGRGAAGVQRARDLLQAGRPGGRSQQLADRALLERSGLRAERPRREREALHDPPVLVVNGSERIT